MNVRNAGGERRRGVEALERLGEPPQLAQHVAAGEMRGRESRQERGGTLGRHERIVQPEGRHQRERLVVLRRGIAGVDRDRTVVAVDRLLQATEGRERDAAIVVRLRGARREGEGAIAALHGLRMSTQVAQDYCPVAPGLGMLGMGRHALLVARKRLLHSPRGAQRVASIDHRRDMARIDRERALAQFDRIRGEPARQAQARERGQGIRIRRIDGKRLLVGRLRLARAARGVKGECFCEEHLRGRFDHRRSIITSRRGRVGLPCDQPLQLVPGT